jgi:hypothetical protein
MVELLFGFKPPNSSDVFAVHGRSKATGNVPDKNRVVRDADNFGPYKVIL